ncbi:MAG: sigma-70 family RNA polymerase sigma factor [Bryobacterales bacterium]|nr:sigma-70 family RNA polymerase sigma factor [Bryobacterales bacterium]
MPGLTRELAGWLLYQPARDESGRGPSAAAVEVSRLFDELRAPLLRYLMSLGLTVPDGEDIVQEVFLALFRHLRREKPRDNLRAWIFRVGHNLALKRRRQNGRSPGTLNGVPVEALSADLALNPEEHAERNRRQARLRAVVQALPDRDRCCLYLRAEGLRYREIAEALEMSLGAVSISLTRSLARLSRSVGE